MFTPQKGTPIVEYAGRDTKSTKRSGAMSQKTQTTNTSENLYKKFTVEDMNEVISLKEGEIDLISAALHKMEKKKKSGGNAADKKER